MRRDGVDEARPGELERFGGATEILVAEEPDLAQQAHGLGRVGGGDRLLHRLGQVAALRLGRWAVAAELEPGRRPARPAPPRRMGGAVMEPQRYHLGQRDRGCRSGSGLRCSDMFSTMQSMPTLSNTTWARFSRSLPAFAPLLAVGVRSAAGSSPTVMLTAILQIRADRERRSSGPFPAREYVAKG